MGRLVYGYKTDDARCFAYIAQNRERAGFTNTLAVVLCDFTPRQRRRMRHKANRHKDTVGYPQLEERWRRMRASRRESRGRERALTHYERELLRGQRILGAETVSGGDYLG